jgi:transposase
VLAALKERENGLAVQPLLDGIERLRENVKVIEGELRTLADSGISDDDSLMRGDWPWTIRAFLDDIGRFASAKKFAAFAEPALWVQDSNETVRHGRITKRGPEELWTAPVQVVMGMRRLKAETLEWRLMRRHEALKRRAGSGKSIIATARKVAVIIWHMLSRNEEFNAALMIDGKLKEKAEAMGKTALSAGQAAAAGGIPPAARTESGEAAPRV